MRGETARLVGPGEKRHGFGDAQHDLDRHQRGEDDG
jgi:hypothetical protein